MNGPFERFPGGRPTPGPRGPRDDRRDPPPGRPGDPAYRRPRFRLLRQLSGAALAVGLLVSAGGAFVVWRKYEALVSDLPTLGGLRDYQPPVMSRIFSSDDRVIAELAAERRLFVPYAAIPDRVKNAFVATEDQNFWTHGGVDPLAMLRAAVTDLETLHKRRPIGASTITQQVARIMVLGSNARTFDRKAKEAILAIRIEQTLSKERILEIYLNEIYLGAGAYGIAAASQAYFNKPLDQLDDAEAAFLGALPKSPTNYNPYRFPEAAKARRDFVLDRMVDTHAISAADAARAKSEPLIPQSFKRPGPVPGSEWFSEEVRRQLIDRYGLDQTMQGGLVVHTSLDPALQEKATTALRDGLMRYDRAHGGWRGAVAHLDGVGNVRRPKRARGEGASPPAGPSWETRLAGVPRPAGMLPGWRLGVILSPALGQVGWLEDGDDSGTGHTGTLLGSDIAWMRVFKALRPGDVIMVEPRGDKQLAIRQIPQVEGAIVSMDPSTGRVLALSGGWSFENSQFNRATQALRQPGSSFKPIVYLAAMEKGISPSQKFLDAPYVNGNWRPNNYEMTFGGPTTVHDALRESLNLVTIRIAADVGMGNVAKTAIDLHEVDSMPKVLPAALGAVETTVLREAGAYASIESGGREVLPSLIDAVQDRDGHVIWRPAGLSVQNNTDPQTPPVLTDARRQVADPASSFQVVQMMQDVVKNGTGKPAVIGIDNPVAGKTGTSQDFHDAWFAGFTPNLLTVVWIGFDAPQSLGDKQTGGAVAGPIWNQFMKQALADRPRVDFRVPDGVALVRYNTGRGETVDAFKPGQEPGAGGSGTVVASTDELSAADTGAENVPDGEAAMGSPGMGGGPTEGGTATADASSSALASPANPGQRGAAPPGASPPAARPPAAAGGDIGMGGLY
ncbi:penicillin-binding protein 1A [Rhizosaccharibacter radicis]|uniref:Penicillin-binding protein 1A n=1 Tax=Rhizosaccharibacter radicis TaxID=2782605 RepID=A0ABT1VZZ8_9PROT|nr:PBP1A family penicillin-binding protein [Acetobacteraceae bacterium KSS12]